MKRLALRIFLLSIVACLALSCDRASSEAKEDVEVKFSVATTVKASGSSWAEDDMIGIFMMPTSSEDLEPSSEYYNNVAYQAVFEDNVSIGFEAYSSKIYYPQSGAVDFVAYYPYNSAFSDGVYSVDISEQADPEAIDFMVSNLIVGVSRNKMEQVFEFYHKLTRVTFNIKKGDSVSSLTGLEASFANVYTTALYDVTQGNDEQGEGFTSFDDMKEVKMNVTVADDGLSAVATALLLPGDVDCKILFMVGGSSYESSFLGDLESGINNIYTVNVGI